jgi:hypothetical protein
VAKGYSQVEGLDFDETFALIARLESIRILFAYVTHHDFKLYQIDIKSAFLNGPIKEEVYVEQPPGFECEEYPNHVYKVHKALYGLKQAPRDDINYFITPHDVAGFQNISGTKFYSESWIGIEFLKKTGVLV